LTPRNELSDSTQGGKKYEPDLDPDYVERATAAEMIRREQLAEKKREREEQERISKHADQSDQFFYIAGYTSGGAPYGVTWEEMGLEPWEELE